MIYDDMVISIDWATQLMDAGWLSFTIEMMTSGVWACLASPWLHLATTRGASVDKLVTVAATQWDHFAVRSRRIWSLIIAQPASSQNKLSQCTLGTNYSQASKIWNWNSVNLLLLSFTYIHWHYQTHQYPSIKPTCSHIFSHWFPQMHTIAFQAMSFHVNSQAIKSER